MHMVETTDDPALRRMPGLSSFRGEKCSKVDCGKMYDENGGHRFVRSHVCNGGTLGIMLFCSTHNNHHYLLKNGHSMEVNREAIFIRFPEGVEPKGSVPLE